MIVALHAVRRGQEILVLVLPEGTRTILDRLVPNAADLVGPVLDYVSDGVLAAERDRLVDDPGCDIFHPITSGTHYAGGSSPRPCSRRAPGRGRTCRRTPPRSRDLSRPHR